jgi:hypothetical protein
MVSFTRIDCPKGVTHMGATFGVKLVNTISFGFAEEGAIVNFKVLLSANAPRLYTSGLQEVSRSIAPKKTNNINFLFFIFYVLNVNDLITNRHFVSAYLKTK